jgi:hypothetical protein
MHPEHGMHACLHEQRQMGRGTKAPVSSEDVTRAPLWREPADLGEIMGAQGGCQHLPYHAGASMQQRQEVGHGEPTPRQWCAGLATMLLQGGGIGHGKTGPIDPKGPMASPASLIKSLGLPSVPD